MFPINSLRFRVAFFYALLGAGLSIVLCSVLFITVQQMGHRLMDETLRAELEVSVERHLHNPSYIPPNTISIKGYVLTGKATDSTIPAAIKSLPQGSSNVTIGEIDYRVLVADRNGYRYCMLFDTDKQHEREAQFYRILFVFALLMTVASAAIGFWLAISIISPLSRLAQQFSQSEPGDVSLSLSKLARNDEVGDLARAFERYLNRLREFAERESYFTADVSHELRTPLAIILGTVEVLEQDGMLSTKQRDRISRIKRAIQDMIEFTSALMLMSRERKPASDEHPFKIGEMVRGCIEKHQELIAGRNIQMKVEISADPSLIVERPLLEIVIGNLIRNALFNMHEGTVLLRLEEGRLIVQDSGHGMRPEELARALERHFKGAKSTGAGVGLSLVKRICDRYGWKISLESEQGIGTTAQIILPSKK